jgi:PKD repeat protein
MNSPGFNDRAFPENGSNKNIHSPKSAKSKTMKKLLLLFTGLLFSMTSMATTDSLWVKGLVTNIANGAPVAYHTVAIEIDSTTGWGFLYAKNTDSLGRYASHIPLIGPTGYIRIEVWDCNQVLHRLTRYYDLNSVDTLYQDFQICDSTTPCHAFYTYASAQTDPQMIQFQDESTGNILYWTWNFGDPPSGSSNTSSIRNPTHYFSSPGYYNVCLTIQGADSLCHDTYCYNILVDSTSGNCHAAFTYYQDSLNSDNTYHFVDQSYGNITSWAWNFDDPLSGMNGTSTLQNPVHTYLYPGTYNVCLTIQGADSLCHDTYCSPLTIDSTITLHIYGTLTDSVSHNPIPYHPVIIDNDTMNGSFYIHHRLMYTDNNGVYNDTIILPSSEIPWRFIIRTYDGNHNQYYFGTGYYGGPPFTQHDFSIYSCAPSTCHADFVSFQDSASPLTVHFMDESSGNINSWYWSFGDGTHSFDRNPTHTFLHAGEVHHVCLIVKDTTSSCCDVYCLDVVPGITGCQANFVFYSDAPGSDHIVHFKNRSTGNPTSWLWNFDDPPSGSGNVSTLQDVDHIFAAPGTHHVCLTITGDSCSSTFCRDVFIPDSINYHQVYGQVFAGNFPLEFGVAMLFSQNMIPNSVPYSDVSTIDSNGVYIFNQVPDGKYVISAESLVIPDEYMRTWYIDVFMWDQATEIVLGEPSNPYNIHLVPLGSPVPGPGLISGRINSETLPNQLLASVNMILMDSNLKPIALCPVSVTGQFVFPSLDYGTYYLHPELMGFYGDIVKVEISSSKPHGEIVMTLTGHQILGIENLQTKAEAILIYPNPVTDQLTISFNLKASNKISIDVFTINGQLILSRVNNVTSGISSITLPFSALNEGMYILKIHSEDGINIVRRVIKSK